MDCHRMLSVMQSFMLPRETHLQGHAREKNVGWIALENGHEEEIDTAQKKGKLHAD
jgi:hypothetical protein